MILSLAAALVLNPGTLTFEGTSGPGKGKHIVFLAGDEEYRSEEMLPQFAKIMANRHGFKCTVGFSLNDKGEIDPDNQVNQTGLDALKSADLVVLMLRFRRWPDEHMSKFVDYVESGKPIVAIRTSTHAFNYPADSPSDYRAYSWNSSEWEGGFGKQVLGETWISHWGDHGSQATGAQNMVRTHPILRGVEAGLFGPSDVYEAHPPQDAQVLVSGAVLQGMTSDAKPAQGRKRTVKGVEQDLNSPAMPILWVRERPVDSGKRQRIVTSTMGSAVDFMNAPFRRIMANSCFWAMGMNPPTKTNVDLVGKYEPSMFGFGTYRKGIRPEDLAASLP